MEYSGNLIIAGSGLAINYLIKKILKEEIIPVSNGKQIGLSFGFLFLTTILGKVNMDQMLKYNLVTFDTTGKEKMPNEGFIGPYEKDDIFLGPDRKNRQIIQGMKKNNRRNISPENKK